jgi:methylphosphotriester-DNA--protein-cysteine methyltransferase
MPLHGSSAVLETFRRLAQIRQHVTDARFVFLVDSDNKPTSFFSKLEATNKKFYDESFVVLDVHEFENLFLDAALFELVIKRYLSIAGNEAKCPSLMDIQAKLTGFARKTLERVYKKELSLAFQQEIERHFAQAIWGNKSFRWDTPTEVNTDLGTHITAHTGPTLNTALMAIATQTYATYHSMTETTLLARCDGKQALAEACHYFSSIAGAKYDAFREALLKAGVHLTGSKPASVVADLLKRMHA